MNANATIAPVRTTCPYCGVGCGLRVQPEASGKVVVSGDPVHPANRGRLCSKGAALGETVGLDGRLLHPMQRQDGRLARVTWDAALSDVAQGFQRIADAHGPGAVAFYLSGQLLTEDYYVANKLMKGFIGSAHVDTNSRLCMASSVAGHRRAFGSDTVPGTYDDLDKADLIVLVGSNTAWCHPVLYQRMVRNRQERSAKIVVIDPRQTATCEDADLFLPIMPGTDSILFCGLLAYLADKHALDFDYIEQHTKGFEDVLASARAIAPSVIETARRCGLDRHVVSAFFELVRNTRKTVTCYSQGVNQSAQGTDKVNAILNCHLATGRMGREGMGPFSLTGQPNAMGGREVGGLANQLAAHMNFTPGDIDRVRRFWNAPRMAEKEGLKAVQMFEAIERGEIKALWVMATNPAVSLPDAGRVRDALRKLELFVVSDNVLSNDTINSGAHYLLPASAWGEKDGTVTNSERRISRQRAFLAAPGDARPDWWIVSQVARRMGFGKAFAYETPADIFREHAALSAFENDGTRDFDLGAFSEISQQDYDGLKPVLWPARKGETPEHDYRFFAEGGYFTPDRKARFVAPQPPKLSDAVSDAFPYRLNTGRVRDQWHTMTRTGKSARLATHLPEPFVEVHPDDAAAVGLIDGGFARLTSAHGSCTLKVIISEGQQRGSLFVPIHWSDATASSARIGELVAPRTDPFSGQPEAKATPVAIAPVALPFRGFTRTRRPLALPQGTWWARVTTAQGEETRLASDQDVMAWHEIAQANLGEDAQLVEYVEADATKKTYRAVAFVDGEFDACLAVGGDESVLRWDGLAQVIAAGPPKDGAPPTVTLCKEDLNAAAGPTVCACFDVGLNTLRDALRSGAVTSLDDIAAQFKAGSNCGSCLPELKRVIARERLAAAAPSEG